MNKKELNKLRKQMTPKQLKFCNEYLKTANGKQSAIEAGYSKNSAAVIANENLSKPYLKRYIEIQQKEIEDQTIADAVEIQRYLTSIIRGETTEEVFIGLGKGKEEVYDKTPSVADRTRAAELMGRRYALFTDRVDVEGNVGAVIVDDIPSDEE